MHKRESVFENETHKILWDFKVKMNHKILTRVPNLVLINKKEKKRTFLSSWFCRTKGLWNKNKCIDKQILGSCPRTKKAMEHEDDDGDTNHNWYTWNGSQDMERGMEEWEIKRRNDTIQVTALLKPVSRRVLESGRDLLSLRLQWKTDTTQITLWPTEQQ